MAQSCRLGECPCRDDRYLTVEDRIVIEKKHFGIAEEKAILVESIQKWLMRNLDQSEKANARKIKSQCLREWNVIPSSGEGRVFESESERDFWLGLGLGGHVHRIGASR